MSSKTSKTVQQPLYSTGSCTWRFSDESVQKFFRTWNSNLKVIFDLPVQTHSWIPEKLDGGDHMKKMIYKRFIKFLSSINKNRRASLKALLKISMNNVRSTTGSNLRSILLDTGVHVIPGVTKSSELKSYSVYEIPENKEWIVPLLTLLIEIRKERWCVLFDEERDELAKDDITAIIDDLCVN